jgi:hypothetical protein
MTRVVSTVPAYQRLVGVGPSADPASTWIERYESRHQEVFTSYYSAWGDPGARIAAAAGVAALAPRLAEREGRARRLLADTAGRLQARGLLEESDVDAVLLVGVGSSDGWVASLNEAPTLFLALELLPDPPFDAILVAHEMTHLAHERRHPPHWPETVGTRLFAEGLAVAVSRRVVPGHSPVDYLWWDGRHQDWLAECAERKDEIAAALLADLDLEESLGEQYFSARSAVAAGWPVRCGYWCGLLAVDDLLGTWAEADLFDLPAAAATAELRRALAARLT